MPFWCCSKLAYLAFVRYANSVPFEDPITLSVALKAKKKMQPEMESRWKRLENTLSKATHTLLARYNVQGGPPPAPRYLSVHLSARYFTTSHRDLVEAQGVLQSMDWSIGLFNCTVMFSGARAKT